MANYFKEYKFKLGGERYISMDKLIARLEKHDNGNIDEEHRINIDGMKERLKAGEKLPPIKITQRGERITGFKRWHAHAELGLTEINCVVMDNWHKDSRL